MTKYGFGPDSRNIDASGFRPWTLGVPLLMSPTEVGEARSRRPQPRSEADCLRRSAGLLSVASLLSIGYFRQCPLLPRWCGAAGETIAPMPDESSDHGGKPRGAGNVSKRGLSSTYSRRPGLFVVPAFCTSCSLPANPARQSSKTGSPQPGPDSTALQPGKKSAGDC